MDRTFIDDIRTTRHLVGPWAILHISFALAVLLHVGRSLGQARGSEAPAAEAFAAPLPTDAELPAFMQAVEHSERRSEMLQQDYLFHQVQRMVVEHGDRREVAPGEEADIFYLQGVRVEKVTRRKGKDLTPEELQKEDAEIDKGVARAKKRKTENDAKGIPTDAAGNPTVTVARLLELGSYSHARRDTLGGRPAILVDYTGNPKAKSEDIVGRAVKNVEGTIWVDEQDRVIERLDLHFVNDFKLGGGLLVDIRKDAHILVDLRKINDEVWLPAGTEVTGHVRAFLFLGGDGDFTWTDGGYRKFKATTTILPGYTPVDPAAGAPPAAKPPDPQPLPVPPSPAMPK